MIWLVDSMLDVFIFKFQAGPLPQQLLYSLYTPAHELYMRLVFVAVLAITCVVTLNLTRSKEVAEEAQALIEEKYQNLFESMMNGFAYHEMVYDDNGKPIDYTFLEINSAFENFTGLQRENVIGKKVTQILPGIENEDFDWIGIYGKVALTGEEARFERYFEPLNRWYSVLAFSPRKHFFAAVFEDATERKNAEEALRESEEKYRGIFNNAQVGLFRSRIQDGTALEANERLAKMLGYTSREEMIRDFIAQDRYADPGDREAMVAELKSTGEVKNFETRFTRNDGSIIWIRFSARLHPDKGYLEGIATDITEQKHAQEEVLKHQNHLEELVEARTHELKETQDKLIASERLAVLGQFSGNVSHEIRNPLGVIGSSVYYLKRRLDTKDEKITAHLDKIENQVEICTGIIESILKLTRMDSPDLQLLDLNRHLHDILDSFRPPEGIKLELDLPDSPVWVQGDGGQLEIVFTNIIQNAVQAVDKEGSVSVSLCKITTADGGRAEIKFKDTGPGIPREELDKVFQPLFTTRATGIGFGLSIAKMVVERHNGDISAESNPEQGATFTVTLPLTEEPERKADQT